jgi:hypothetical protein
MVDALLLLLLMTAFFGYRDFDDPMRIFVRGATVAFFAYIWISGLHLLIFLRHEYRGKAMPGLISYGLFLAKAGVLCGMAYWAHTRTLL